MGIEPTCVAWKATVLPLNYSRISGGQGRIRTFVGHRPPDLQSGPFGCSGTCPHNMLIKERIYYYTTNWS